MRRNPFAPIVPCHRVIASDLRLGGFSGSWVRILRVASAATLATHLRFCSLQIANCCDSTASKGATFLVMQGEDTTNVRRKRSMLEAEGVVFNIKMQECKVALTSVVQLDELTKLCAGLGR